MCEMREMCERRRDLNICQNMLTHKKERVGKREKKFNLCRQKKKKKDNLLLQIPLTDELAENKFAEAFATVLPVADVRIFNALLMSSEIFWIFCFLAASSTS